MKPEEQKVFMAKIAQFIWLVFGVIEGLIGLRVLLKLVGANPDNPFATFIYGLTGAFLWPFARLTAMPQVGDMVFEMSSIIAMLVYAILAWVLVKGVTILLYPMRGRSSTGGTQELP